MKADYPTYKIKRLIKRYLDKPLALLALEYAAQNGKIDCFARTPREALQKGFIWKDTREGSEYWASIWRNLPTTVEFLNEQLVSLLLLQNNKHSAEQYSPIDDDGDDDSENEEGDEYE